MAVQPSTNGHAPTEKAPSSGRLPLSAVAGAVAWVVVLAIDTGMRDDRIVLVDLFFLLAPLVVVPLGLAILGDLRSGARGGAHAWIALAQTLWPLGAIGLVASYFFDPGPVSGALAGGWVAVGVLTTVGGVFWLVQARSGRAEVLAPAAALAFLLLGGVGFCLSRLGGPQLGLSRGMVFIASVHLHYAGFGALLLCWLVLRVQLPRSPSRSVAAGACVGAILGAPVAVAGMLWDPVSAAVGGILLGASLAVAAGLTLGLVTRGASWPRVPPVASILMGVSAASVFFGMFLGMQFAIGTWLGQATLSIPRMIEFHGGATGLGFVLLGLLGWTLAGDSLLHPPRSDRF